MQRRTVHNSPTNKPAGENRRAHVAFEFLLATPLALALVFAIAEFGILLASVKFVEMAALEGAREVAAMERPQLNRSAAAARRRADRVLATAGLGRCCAVYVRHNVPQGSHPQARHGDCPCGPTRKPLPRHPRVSAVECTVSVPMSRLTPNLLAFIGFSTTGRHVTASHTVPYLRDEREPTP